MEGVWQVFVEDKEGEKKKKTSLKSASGVQVSSKSSHTRLWLLEPIYLRTFTQK